MTCIQFNNLNKLLSFTVENRSRGNDSQKQGKTTDELFSTTHSNNSLKKLLTNRLLRTTQKLYTRLQVEH